jgi:predicted RNA-binding protein with PUA-like domain
MAYWLMKSEPTAFSIDDLQAQKRALWDGVRNYQARNFMRAMQVGDQVFFYHSSCPEPGIVGIMEIVRAAYTDPTQFDPENHHFDPKSTPEKPRWDGVDVGFKKKLKSGLALGELRAMPELDGLALLRQGNRLSVMPVTDGQWAVIKQRIG